MIVLLVALALALPGDIALAEEPAGPIRKPRAPGPVVHIEYEGLTPPTLYEVAPDSTREICTAPCDLAVATGGGRRHFIGGRRLVGSRRFNLASYRGRVDITVRPIRRPVWWTGVVLSGAGVLVGTIDSAAYGNVSELSQGQLRTSIGLGAAALILLIPGIVMTVLKSRVELKQGERPPPRREDAPAEREVPRRDMATDPDPGAAAALPPAVPVEAPIAGGPVASASSPLDPAIDPPADAIARRSDSSVEVVEMPVGAGSDGPGRGRQDRTGRGMIGAGAAMMGVGGVGLAIMGGGMGVAAKASRELANSQPGADRADVFQRGKTGNAMAVAGGVMAGVSLVVGIGLLAAGVIRRRRDARRATLVPLWIGGGAGLGVVGRFGR